MGERVYGTFASQLWEPGARGRQGTASEDEGDRRKGLFLTHPPSFPTSGLTASAGRISRFT